MQASPAPAVLLPASYNQQTAFFLKQKIYSCNIAKRAKENNG